MKSILDRFLKYVSFDTRSEENSSTHPSAEKEFRLAELLRAELQELGLAEAVLTGLFSLDLNSFESFVK